MDDTVEQWFINSTVDLITLLNLLKQMLEKILELKYICLAISRTVIIIY